MANPNTWNNKNRKRKHFEMDKNRQSPFQNRGEKRQNTTVVSKAPRGINVVEFAESRAMEIQNMMMALSNASETTSNKRIFQSIPRHMRRRAASHNVKRMPVRLRDAYIREAAKSESKMKEPKKKKTRRQHRKPSNMLAEYNRRQRTFVWLETHIWHAKRFKMVELWGYKIPLHPNDKSVRASYRAMATSCLMQDLSYYQCIEICGKQDLIIAAMKHLTSPDIGLTMAAKQYVNGSFEGQVVLYECDKYPWNAIGPVSFLWQQLHPVTVANSTEVPQVKLWVWTHPACGDSVSHEIVRACSLVGSTRLMEEKQEEEETATTSEDTKEPEAKVSKEPSEKPSDFVVSVLKEQLTRFRLIGPKSHSLLASMLETYNTWIAKDGVDCQQWWQRYGGDDAYRQTFQEQNALWKQLKGGASPGVLAGGSVLSLVVRDPRLALPSRKSSVDMATNDLYQGTELEEPAVTRCPAGSAVSPIWDILVRDEVKQTKLPEKDLNERRSKMVVPGLRLDLGESESRIPILLVQQPGTRGDIKSDSISFGCGYDLIAPAGWSMAFWVALVYRGARVGGSRELATCSREQGVSHFPRDFPDTQVGGDFNKEQARAGSEKYARYPPAKRPNYEKLAVLSPFSGDWSRLVDEWSEEVGRMEAEFAKETNSYVTRIMPERAENAPPSRDQLVSPRADEGMSREQSTNPCNTTTITTTTHSTTLTPTDHPTPSSSSPPSNQNFFVIRSCLKRRRLEQILQDLHQTAAKSKTKPAKNCSTANFISHTQYLRTNLDTSLFSRALLAISLVELSRGCPLDNALVCLPTPEDLRALAKDDKYGGPVEPGHHQKADEKDGDASRPLITSASRKLIGFVSSGEYSLARGRGSALAFCSFPAISELLLQCLREKSRPLLLVRNTKTYQYRFASFRVIV